MPHFHFMFSVISTVTRNYPPASLFSYITSSWLGLVKQEGYTLSKLQPKISINGASYISPQCLLLWFKIIWQNMFYDRSSVAHKIHYNTIFKPCWVGWWECGLVHVTRSVYLSGWVGTESNQCWAIQRLLLGHSLRYSATLLETVLQGIRKHMKT